MSAAMLAPEWDRVETLTDIVRESRESQKISEDKIQALQDLQRSVVETRENGSWKDLTEAPLAPLEYDVLACAVAPVLSPRIAVMFQALQGKKEKPFPSLHFLQELLSLAPQELPALHATVNRQAPLQTNSLIKIEGSGPFATVEPTPKVTQHVMGFSGPTAPPPGTHEVFTDATWNDLILPKNQLNQLQVFLAYITHRKIVEDDWGSRASPGPVALFSGASGTGKTFAAGVLANELGWPLYRVDLGRLVSKYIGETEKNLNELFNAAHGQDMVLQFDEADALFSKRGEVKEARDRYANLEVSHLLTRIESHRGPCILTSNLRAQMDVAFARRFQVVVDFPRPDKQGRQKLWERSLPSQAPLGDDLDLELVAESVKLNGGSIRNAAHHAAINAALDGEALSQHHIADAVWRELGKEGRPVSRDEMGDLSLDLKRRPR